LALIAIIASLNFAVNL